MSADQTSDAGWRTWPNVITVIRLALLPLFIWLLFDTNHRAIAAWLLATLGATDWIDGFVARRWHQVSNVGKILDPVADRVLVITGLLCVAAAAGVPWWFALTTLARELIVSVLTLVLASLGAARIDVLWWGKVSTFALMTSFPLFLLTTNPHHAALQPWQHATRDACWVIAIMGLTLSWIVLIGYVKPAMRALRTGRQARRFG
jgi:cardiolipin synthase